MKGLNFLMTTTQKAVARTSHGWISRTVAYHKNIKFTKKLFPRHQDSFLVICKTVKKLVKNHVPFEICEYNCIEIEKRTNLF